MFQRARSFRLGPGTACGLGCIALLVLSGCQTYPVGRDAKAEIRAALSAYKHAVNARSYDALSPLLAKSLSIDGLPDDISRAGLAAGMKWLPFKIVEVRILAISGSTDGYEARTALCMDTSYLPLRVGFNSAFKIRSIGALSPEKPKETNASAPFASRFAVSGGLPFVQARVDGRQGWFLLDTGSSGLLLNQKYFRKPDGPAMPAISAGVNGLAPGRGSHPVRLLTWGSLSASNISGKLHDFSVMEQPPITPLLGAISHSELRNSSVVFDWKAKSIQVFPTRSDGSRKPVAGEPQPALTMPFTYYMHMPVIRARIGERDFDVLFDSGAQLNLLPDTSGIESHFRQTSVLSGFSSGGSPSDARSPLGTVDRITIGQAEFLDLPFAVYQIPYLQGKGMLGTPLLQQGRVELNFRARRISIWPRD